MSVNSMKPTFADKEGYQAWRNSWRIVYRELSKRIRRRKAEMRELQRTTQPLRCCGQEPSFADTLRPGSESRWHQVTCEQCGKHGPLVEGCSLTYFGRDRIASYANEAVRGWNAQQVSIGDRQRELLLMRADATKMMTLLGEAKARRDRILEMHKSITEQPFPVEVDANRVDVFYNRGHNEFSFLPRWVVQTKGKSFYVDHIDADVPWSTRELDTGSTRGMMRFRKCRVNICKDRIATLRAA